MIDDFQSYHDGGTQQGTLGQWNDDKGYGWIESGGRRFFAHIKDFDRGPRRPTTGEALCFIRGTDSKGRACAKQVTFVKVGKAQGDLGVSRASGSWFRLGLLLVLPLLALLWLPLPWWVGVGWLLFVSWVTDGLYVHDKQQAVSRGWRVSEGSLHLAELLGGWPGAFLAQRRLRHKCSKPSYQVVYRAIVAIYQVCAVDVMLDQRLSRAVIGIFNG